MCVLASWKRETSRCGWESQNRIYCGIIHHVRVRQLRRTDGASNTNDQSTESDDAHCLNRKKRLRKCFQDPFSCSSINHRRPKRNVRGKKFLKRLRQANLEFYERSQWIEARTVSMTTNEEEHGIYVPPGTAKWWPWLIIVMEPVRRCCEFWAWKDHHSGTLPDLSISVIYTLIWWITPWPSRMSNRHCRHAHHYARHNYTAYKTLRYSLASAQLFRQRRGDPREMECSLPNLFFQQEGCETP